jgi:Uma2 family endonuclease
MNAHQQIAPPQPVELSVDHYTLLDQAGALDDYERTELIEGVIYAVQAQHRPHSYAVNELAFRLRVRLEEIGSDLFPLIESTVDMRPSSAPLPDISLTSEPRGTGFIPLHSMALIVEVADSSVRHDLNAKAPLYASQTCWNIGCST